MDTILSYLNQDDGINIKLKRDDILENDNQNVLKIDDPAKIIEKIHANEVDIKFDDFETESIEDAIDTLGRMSLEADKIYNNIRFLQKLKADMNSVALESVDESLYRTASILLSPYDIKVPTYLSMESVYYKWTYSVEGISDVINKMKEWFNKFVAWMKKVGKKIFIDASSKLGNYITKFEQYQKDFANISIIPDMPDQAAISMADTFFKKYSNEQGAYAGNLTQAIRNISDTIDAVKWGSAISKYEAALNKLDYTTLTDLPPDIPRVTKDDLYTHKETFVTVEPDYSKEDKDNKEDLRKVDWSGALLNNSFLVVSEYDISKINSSGNSEQKESDNSDNNNNNSSNDSSSSNSSSDSNSSSSSSNTASSGESSNASGSSSGESGESNTSSTPASESYGSSWYGWSMEDDESNSSSDSDTNNSSSNSSEQSSQSSTPVASGDNSKSYVLELVSLPSKQGTQTYTADQAKKFINASSPSDFKTTIERLVNMAKVIQTNIDSIKEDIELNINIKDADDSKTGSAVFKWFDKLKNHAVTTNKAMWGLLKMVIATMDFMDKYYQTVKKQQKK